MGTDAPLISIVTVVFNDVNNIERTLLSVKNQSYKNIEYIVIDGGSSDGTIDIIKEHKNCIAYFKSEKDCGIYDAMNKSLPFLNGLYVYFLNSGDVIYDDKTLERIIHSSDCTDDIIYCDTILILKEEKYYLPYRKLTVSDPMPFCHQSVLVNVNLLKSHKFDSRLRISADKKFFKHCLTLNIKYKSLDFPLGCIDGDGFSNKNRLLQLKENQSIFNETEFTYILKCLKQYLIIFSIKICPKLIYSKVRSYRYSKNKKAYNAFLRKESLR